MPWDLSSGGEIFLLCVSKYSSVIYTKDILFINGACTAHFSRINKDILGFQGNPFHFRTLEDNNLVLPSFLGAQNTG